MEFSRCGGWGEVSLLGFDIEQCERLAGVEAATTGRARNIPDVTLSPLFEGGG